MFERYTVNARRVIFFARVEAGRLGSPEITCLHMLLGSLEQSGPILLAAGLRGTVQALADDLRRALPEAREPIPTNLDLPLAADCETALLASVAEADHLSSRNVNPAHMVLGLAQAAPELATIMANHGIERPKLVEVARQLADDEPM